MTDSIEVTVIGPAYWVDHAPQLASLLGSAAEQGTAVPIGDPSGAAPNPETILSVAHPEFWASEVAELQDVLADATGREHSTGARGIAAGATSTAQERLTLTVEEAAAALGISRAFAYESVHRGDIPSIRIGRRILVPRSALAREACQLNRLGVNT